MRDFVNRINNFFFVGKDIIGSILKRKAKNMLFKKQERKKRHPYATLTVFSLAAVGVMGIFKKTKCCIKNALSKMKGFFCRASDEE